MTEDIEQKKTATEVTPQEPKHIQEEEEQDVDMTGDEEQEEEPDREKLSFSHRQHLKMELVPLFKL